MFPALLLRFFSDQCLGAGDFPDSPAIKNPHVPGPKPARVFVFKFDVCCAKLDSDSYNGKRSLTADDVKIPLHTKSVQINLRQLEDRGARLYRVDSSFGIKL
jgi:hypothetical protein